MTQPQQQHLVVVVLWLCWFWLLCCCGCSCGCVIVLWLCCCCCFGVIFIVAVWLLLLCCCGCGFFIVVKTRQMKTSLEHILAHQVYEESIAKVYHCTDEAFLTRRDSLFGTPLCHYQDKTNQNKFGAYFGTPGV